MDIADDSALFAQESIEQGTLPHVRRPSDSHWDATLDRITKAEALGQTLDLLRQFVKELQKLCTISEGHILLTEVQLQLHKAGQLQKSLA